MCKINRSGFFFILIISLTLIGCAKESSKFRENNERYCANSKIVNQFIAHWEDGSTSLILTDDIKNFIKQNEEKIKFVEPNYALKLRQQFENVKLDNPVSSYRILNDIGALEAWRLGYEGQNILVAVIDSGVDIENNKLRRSIYLNPVDSTVNGVDEDGNGFIDDIHGWNFTSNSWQVIDEIGHGTSITGIISGKDISGESLAIAPEAKILPIDIMTGSGGTEFAAKQAVDYAILMKAHIINNSWSINCSQYLALTFQDYEKHNVIFVNSAGNEPVDVVQNRIMLAAMSFSNFLNVGSNNLTGRASVFSGFGKSINIWAPGEQVPVLTNISDASISTNASGTSVSAGIVSGAAALIWSAYPRESAVQIVQRIQRGSAKMGGRNTLAIDRAL